MCESMSRGGEVNVCDSKSSKVSERMRRVFYIIGGDCTIYSHHVFLTETVLYNNSRILSDTLFRYHTNHIKYHIKTQSRGILSDTLGIAYIVPRLRLYYIKALAFFLTLYLTITHIVQRLY